MAGYKTFTTVGDSGPYVSKLILELPASVRANDVTDRSFNVFVERKDVVTGEVVRAKEHHDDATASLSRGYVPVRRAFVSDETGEPAPMGTHVALVLPEVRLTKRIDGGLAGGFVRVSDFRVTQLEAFPAEDATGDPLAGLVFDRCDGDICPQLDGWDLDLKGTFDGIEMRYAAFEPDIAAVNERRSHPILGSAPRPLEKIPVVLWLHGAGEGSEPYRTVTGNKVVALGEADIQAKLGGAAYVLAPSCPTYWMDAGSGQITDDNQSIYSAALKQLVDAFVEAHADTVDTGRIYVGGLSNGGFMTCRLLADWPDLFAAGVACCAPWVGELGTDEEYAAMARTPLWFVQVDDDPIVGAEEHVRATLPHLFAAGATDVHVTYYDHIADETGVYRDEDGRPLRYIGHLVWINVYHDTVRTDLDGTNVLWDGFPVTLWQWVGKHRR